MHDPKRKVFLGAAVAALIVATAARADAQSCAGYPTLPGQGSVGITASFPEGGNGLGVEGSWNWSNPLALFASFTLQNPDVGDNRSIFGGGVAYEVGGFVPAIPAWLGVCPVAAVNFSSLDGTTTLSFPLGLGFGTTFELTPGGPAIIPHVMPQFVLTRVSVDDISVSDNNFAIGFGALARFGPLYAGAAFNRFFVDQAEIDWALRAGLAFAWAR